jgi:DUF4097 and DUF4098 domain-containing protein YvlB
MKTLALLLFLAPRIVQHSMGGDLTVDYAPNGATLRTMGGDIRIARSNCLVIAKTMGGNIRIRQLEGSLDAGTMGGNVEVEVAGNGSGRSIEAWSMGGELELTVPRGFAANFDVVLEQDEDRDHRIVSDIPLHIVETTHRRWFHDVRVLHATSGGAANGNRVYLKTIGGEIRIRTQ